MMHYRAVGARRTDAGASMGGLTASLVGTAVAMLAYAVLACIPRGTGRASSVDLRSLVGAPFRAVWLQDMGDGSDFDAQGDSLRLMGFDSRDPRGEFAILPAIANYARPLITRRGDRVVFSSRRTGRTYVVDWDGTTMREITEGLGVSVWIDPFTGEEWVYVARPGANTNAYGWPMGSISRCAIDDPTRCEPIWDRTDIDVDNFQVSADGTRAGGLLPWPSGGVAELPNGAWTTYAEGCWTSLAPDNSYRSWVFDGNHRDIALFDVGGVNKRVIRLSQRAGIRNCELSHPRWSNHPRYMSMTAPYCVTAPDGSTRSDHTVEVYVGRFNEGFTDIDRFVRLTDNTRADFFPDIWIVPSPDTLDRLPSPPPVAHADPVIAPGQGVGGSPEGAVFVWENRSSSNAVTSGGSFTRTCRVTPRGRAWYGRFFEMVLRGGLFEAQDVDQTMVDEWKNAHAFAVEVMLAPSPRTQRAAAIIAFAPDAGAPQFMLSQSGDSLVATIQTSVSSGMPSSVPLCRLQDTSPFHLIVSYREGRLTCHRDGRKEADVSRIRGGFDSWGIQRLTFGNRSDGSAPWWGSIEGVVLWSRSVDEEEAARRAQGRLAAVHGRSEAETWNLDARLVEMTMIPDPRAIAPYHRALIVNAYDVVGDPPEGSSRILVAHWGILDRAVVAGVSGEVGSIYPLILQRFEDHPQLESERLLMDTADYTLPLFYDIGLMRARP